MTISREFYPHVITYLKRCRQSLWRGDGGGGGSCSVKMLLAIKPVSKEPVVGT